MSTKKDLTIQLESFYLTYSNTVNEETRDYGKAEGQIWTSNIKKIEKRNNSNHAVIRKEREISIDRMMLSNFNITDANGTKKKPPKSYFHIPHMVNSHQHWDTVKKNQKWDWKISSGVKSEDRIEKSETGWKSTCRVMGRILPIRKFYSLPLLHPGLVSNLFNSLHWMLCAIDLVGGVIF